ncbi:hypothetical protein CRENBAI_000117 [Crenichthys baileyi]|uniref:Uncharacterized protein n=1 Tax=Crenichthys baileyi TaxID=28760 RepID=A0AAV9R036_9TELE
MLSLCSHCRPGQDELAVQRRTHLYQGPQTFQPDRAFKGGPRASLPTHRCLVCGGLSGKHNQAHELFSSSDGLPIWATDVFVPELCQQETALGTNVLFSALSLLSRSSSLYCAEKYARFCKDGC